jgi:hypothetical protein
LAIFPAVKKCEKLNILSKKLNNGIEPSMRRTMLLKIPWPIPSSPPAISSQPAWHPNGAHFQVKTAEFARGSAKHECPSLSVLLARVFIVLTVAAQIVALLGQGWGEEEKTWHLDGNLGVNWTD